MVFPIQSAGSAPTSSAPTAPPLRVATAGEALFDLIEEPDGRLNADFGDGFMMVMDWAPDGALSTRVIQQWGASEHPESPHFNDQSEMFANYQWRSLDLNAR